MKNRMLTRRHFIAASAAVAGNLFAAPKDSKTPSPELEKLGDTALREARKFKATYCDIRIVRLRDDKPVAEIDTLSRVREIFASQVPPSRATEKSEN